MISCSACHSSSHPHCLELNPKLVDWQCIRQYAWECMECKKCSICSQAHDDDKMMFCDRCDRGFHTYCVNVSQVPEGAWLCKTCTECTAAASSDQKVIKSFCEANRVELMESHVLLKNISKSPLLLKGEPSTTTAATTPAVISSVKQRLSSVDSLPASMSEKRKGRGRPPGSLNKPKDPNSPKKSA